MSPLAGKNVRGLAVTGNTVASGAEDASIRLFDIKNKVNELASIRIPLPGQTEIHTPVHI